MRRYRPFFLALAGFVLFSLALRPKQGYLKALVTVYSPPVCEVPADRRFGIEYYGMIYSGNTTNLIDRRVLCTGSWETHIQQFLGRTAEMLERVKGEPADDLVFLDIGANTGLHSMFMSRYVGVIHAFDPYPPVVAQMRYNLERNNLQNVILHPVGLGDAAARLPFVEPKDSNQGTGSFLPEAGLPGRMQGLELEVVVGDDYFREHGIDRADLVKIDVEGFEKPVLLGLRRTFAKTRPIIEFEITVKQGVERLFRSREELEAALPEDYELFGFTGSDPKSGAYKLVDFPVDFGAFLGGQWDLVAAPAELADELPMVGEASW
ncbi:MAG: FkbM family methyltransferase [Acidobacteria bacterium]|nr:FkbM family methyltransferase [Acidobacteriota bacterium]